MRVTGAFCLGRAAVVMPAVNWGISWLLVTASGRLAQVPGARHPFAGRFSPVRFSSYCRRIEIRAEQVACHCISGDSSRLRSGFVIFRTQHSCLLYTSDAADE